MRQLELPLSLDLEFEAGLSKLLYKRLHVLFWVGFTLFPLFLVLDWVVARQHFEIFCLLRFAVSLSLLFLLFVRSTQIGRDYPFAVAMAGYLSCGLAISVMVLQTGGYHSFYYVGLICLLVAFSSILPLNRNQSISSGVLMYLLYVLPVLMFDRPDSQASLIFFNNNFFFCFFLIVSVLKSCEDYKARKKEFQLRRSLDHHAANLEKEVAKRVKKHEESELRYKELYENILDGLVMIDSDHRILIANPNFYQWTGDPSASGKKPSLIEFVHPDDFSTVREVMLERLFSEVEIRDFEFRLLNTRNEIIFVECNAKGLAKAGHVIGYQLVLRDVTFRKKLENDLVNSLGMLKNTQAVSIMGLAKLTEYRDNETGAHLERIREYSKVLSVELANTREYRDTINADYIDDIYLSSTLHDIGKVGIPDSILLKPGRLSAREFDIIKRHCQYGGDAIKAIEAKINGESFLAHGREIAYCHHEKWNGEGYPNGYQNCQIPLSARIVAVSDVYDALTRKRIYKDAYSHQTAVNIIRSERSKHFDPDVVDAFLVQSNEFAQIRKQP